MLNVNYNRKFEVPFNHDEELLSFLERNSNKLCDLVAHIFVAPFCEDYFSTRHEEAKKPTSREVYESQINRLIEAGYDVCVLFNMPEIVEIAMLEYYEKLGIHTFTVNSNELAKVLHDRGNTTIASITKRNTLDKIVNMDWSMYDYIVVDYTFNASITNVKKLPKQYKYILMTNTYCDYTCDFYSHWREQSFICPKEVNGFKNTTFVKQEDLYLFDDYISIYKLQGREYSTEEIVTDIAYFVLGMTDKFETSIDTSGDYYERYTKLINNKE